jgi:hypothetical protein
MSLRKQVAQPRKRLYRTDENLIGKIFGRLTVVKLASIGPLGGFVWECLCECGNVITIKPKYLVSGNTRSCGCLKIDLAADRHRTHGLSELPEHRIWEAMKGRCFRRSDPGYKNYGARGITVCKRWLDFGKFIEDVGRRPSPKHSIERLDNDGNYEPGNVIWATRKEQSRNTRRNVFIVHNGVRATLSAWAEMKHFKRGLISDRLKAGWSVEQALDTPARPMKLNHLMESKSTKS